MIYRRLFDVPAWRIRSPFGELERLKQQLDRFSDLVATPYQERQAGVFPLVNLTEDKDNYYVRAELPGVKRDELEIEVTSNNIAISGERKIEPEAEGTRYHRQEREAGKFSRVIGLPDDINPNQVEAKLKNGILTIVIAKAEAARPRQITVQS